MENLSRSKLGDEDVVMDGFYRVVFEPDWLAPLGHPFDISTIDCNLKSVNSKRISVDEYHLHDCMLYEDRTRPLLQEDSWHIWPLA